MERLPSIDASFLYMETPWHHTHTIKVAVLESAAGTAYSIERVRSDLAERLHLLPPFRRGAAIDVEALRAHCSVRLSPYKVPLEFRIVDAVPRTPGGKILRRPVESGAERASPPAPAERR